MFFALLPDRCAELARLAASGTRPPGLCPPPRSGGTAIEVDRAGQRHRPDQPGSRQFNVGYQLAGQKITLRMDGTQMAVLDQAGTLLRTIAAPPCQQTGPGSAGPAFL